MKPFGLGFGRHKDKSPPALVEKSAAPRPVSFGTGSRAVWGSRDTQGLVRTGFLANPVGFRAVRLVCEAAAALPILLQDRETRFDRHPVLDLLLRPNMGQGRVEFLESAYTQLLLSGNAYIEAVGETGLPLELHVLRAERMSVVPGADGWPSAYDYQANGRKHRFTIGLGPAPICHVRMTHPNDDHYGLSPLPAAACAIEVHNAASRWSKALLDNAARPSGAIVYRAEGNASLTTQQYERLVAEMESQHQGARNAGRPMLLEGGLDWRPMGFSPSDMEFQATQEAAARDIAMAFGVPPMLLGIKGEATYANYQEAHRAFYRLTVVPLAERLLGALANWLEDFTGEHLDLRPDVDQIAALSGERDALWARVQAAAFLSEAEKRALLGLPPKGEDDDRG